MRLTLADSCAAPMQICAACCGLVFFDEAHTMRECQMAICVTGACVIVLGIAIGRELSEADAQGGGIESSSPSDLAASRTAEHLPEGTGSRRTDHEKDALQIPSWLPALSPSGAGEHQSGNPQSTPRRESPWSISADCQLDLSA